MKKLIYSLLMSFLFYSHLGLAYSQKGTPLPTKKIIRVSENTLRRNSTVKVAPTYPEIAKASQVNGAVIVEITVDEYGSVLSARVLSGNSLLVDASTQAAKRWQFTPTIIEGEAFRVTGAITLQFNSDGTTSAEKTISAEQQKEDKEKELTFISNIEEQTARALYRLGSAYSEAKRYREAVETYKRALELKIDFAEVYNDLGWAYSELGQEEEAMAAYRQAVFLKPDYALSHHNLGWNLYKLSVRSHDIVDSFLIERSLTTSWTKWHKILVVE